MRFEVLGFGSGGKEGRRAWPLFQEQEGEEGEEEEEEEEEEEGEKDEGERIDKLEAAMAMAIDRSMALDQRREKKQGRGAEQYLGIARNALHSSSLIRFSYYQENAPGLLGQRMGDLFRV
jgi:hypothetical protein